MHFLVALFRRSRYVDFCECAKRIRYISACAKRERINLSWLSLERLAGDKLESRDPRVVGWKCRRMREEESATNFFLRVINSHARTYVQLETTKPRGHTGRKFRRCYRAFYHTFYLPVFTTAL